MKNYQVNAETTAIQIITANSPEEAIAIAMKHQRFAQERLTTGLYKPYIAAIEDIDIDQPDYNDPLDLI